jgi:hypothetical protein
MNLTRLNVIVIGMIASIALQAEAPLRIFIRGSEKTLAARMGTTTIPHFWKAGANCSALTARPHRERCVFLPPRNSRKRTC